jgi:hypothetical protein
LVWGEFRDSPRWTVVAILSNLAIERYDGEFAAVAGPLALTLFGVPIAHEAYSD